MKAVNAKHSIARIALSRLVSDWNRMTRQSNSADHQASVENGVFNMLSDVVVSSIFRVT
jgi:hypothetical protein